MNKILARSCLFMIVASFVLLHFEPQAKAVGIRPTLQQELENGAIRFFTENAHPVTGLIRDKAESFSPAPADNDVASISSTGFGIAVIANAAQRGKIDSQWAEAYYNRVMRYCLTLDREHGWFLHWVNWETGKIVWDWGNDFSNIDTSLFIAGALYAARIFPNSEGAKITNQLYREMDFPWFMTEDGKFPNRRVLSIGYTRENGFIPYQWSGFTEQMIMIALGIGSPTHPLPPEAWDQWERRNETFDGYSGVGLNMPLFIHQYSQAYLDLRDFDDGHNINYFKNSVEATRYNRYVANQDKSHLATRIGMWGISAGDKQLGVWGDAYGVFSPPYHTGTICIGCAIGSAMFLPQTVLEDATAWLKWNIPIRITGRYGFTDSVDFDRHWRAKYTLGITIGMAYLSLANMHDETSIWKEFNRIPEIQNALNKLRRKSIPVKEAAR